jgi:enoyl-CoA hydratase/carnithine racemase
MSEQVQFEFREGVAHVRLTRADSMNALDNLMFDGIVTAGGALKTQRGLRCVVLSGEGRAFCAGIDMQLVTTLTTDPQSPAALLVESVVQKRMMAHPHHAKAVAGNLEKRAPKFEESIRIAFMRTVRRALPCRL